MSYANYVMYSSNISPLNLERHRKPSPFVGKSPRPTINKRFNGANKRYQFPHQRPVALTRSDSSLCPNRLNELLMKQNEMCERLQGLRSHQDEEELEILQSIEERNNNRKFRHAKRKTVNTKVRGEVNAEMTKKGLLGVSPHPRFDSVIAWSSQVKTPTRSNIRLVQGLPATPVIRPDITKAPNPFTDRDHQIQTIEKRISKLISLIQDESKRSMRSVVTDQLATDFCHYFTLLHHEDLTAFRPIDKLSTKLELTALRLLRCDCDTPEVDFLIEGLLHSVPNLDRLLKGQIPFVAEPVKMPSCILTSDDETSEISDLSPSVPKLRTKRVMITPGDTSKFKEVKKPAVKKSNSRTGLWLPTDDEFFASMKPSLFAYRYS